MVKQRLSMKTFIARSTGEEREIKVKKEKWGKRSS